MLVQQALYPLGYFSSLEAGFELRQLLHHRLDNQTSKCLPIVPVLEVSMLEILLQIPVVS